MIADGNFSKLEKTILISMFSLGMAVIVVLPFPDRVDKLSTKRHPFEQTSEQMLISEDGKYCTEIAIRILEATKDRATESTEMINLRIVAAKTLIQILTKEK